MSEPLICARVGCDEVCGKIYPATQTDPAEVIPWHEELMDDNGYCYCSEECLHPEEEDEDA